METLYILLVLLVVARTLGEAAVRFRQPALVGELLGGILVGVIAGAFSERLPVLAGLSDDRVFAAITDLGVFFLMLLAGIEMRPKEFAEASGSSLPVALCAMLLPLGLGFAMTWAWLPKTSIVWRKRCLLARRWRLPPCRSRLRSARPGATRYAAGPAGGLGRRLRRRVEPDSVGNSDGRHSDRRTARCR